MTHRTSAGEMQTIRQLIRMDDAWGLDDIMKRKGLDPESRLVYDADNSEAHFDFVPVWAPSLKDLNGSRCEVGSKLHSQAKQITHRPPIRLGKGCGTAKILCREKL